MNEQLPVGWERVELRALGKWSGGGTPSKKNASYWDGGTIPWVSPKDMKRVTLKGTQDRITERATEESPARRVEANSIAMVVRSGILSRTLPIALVPFEAAYNQDMRVLTPAPELNHTWLLWALVANSEDIRRACQKDGTTVASLDVPRLQGFSIAIPPRAEQDRIVGRLTDLLEQVDVGANSLHSGAAALQQYRSASLHEAFAGVSQRVMLRDIADVASGLTKGRKLSGPVQPYPYLRAANLADAALDLGEIKEIPATEAEAQRYALKPGDVLLVEGSGSPNRIGQGWIWEDDLKPCLHQNHVFRARPDPTRCFPRYLAWAMQSPAVRAYMRSITKTTSGLNTINKRDLSATPIPLPTLQEQEDIARRLDERAALIRQMSRDLGVIEREHEGLRRSILTAAATGALVPQLETDTPASALLASINANGTAIAPRERRAQRKGARA